MGNAPKQNDSQELLKSVADWFIEHFHLKPFAKQLGEWFELMKKHKLLTFLAFAVVAWVSHEIQKEFDERLQVTINEERNGEIKSLSTHRDEFRQKVVDLEIANNGLESRLQTAEISYAPWKQLAMDKFPNDSPLLAITNLLKILTHEIPGLPQLSVTTLGGLPPEKANDSNLKTVQLIIRNTNNVEIDNFCSRLQLPEPIVETIGEPEAQVGTRLNWRPLIDTNVLVNGTGGRNDNGAWVGGNSMLYPQYVEPCFMPPMQGRGIKGTFMTGKTTGIWELQVDKMPPGGYVRIKFLVSKSREYTNYLQLANIPLWQSPPNPSSVPDTNELRYIFEGRYQFQSEIRPGTQEFFVPLMFDPTNRNLFSLPAQTDIGHWHPVVLAFE